MAASSSDCDHGKENVEPAERKCKLLKLNRIELDQWDFIFFRTSVANLENHALAQFNHTTGDILYIIKPVVTNTVI